MDKERAIKFASLMEDYLNIPSFVCEYIEQALISGKYEEVIDYIIHRRNEIEEEEMMDENELLFDEFYEKTKDCGRVQFVKLLMAKERENKELKTRIKEALNVLEKKQRIYSDEERIKQLEQENSIEGVMEILRGNY